ncbi:MAG: hypothetical protein O4805_22385 [Trichodesmium sp. St16_bin2-tuft]|nr:hypothetical protein [Trichodesmium sp. St16_bin2-tuft]MDE5120552.1 hypothetical protein [Trichodesmium sp. St19_bin1]
MSVDHSREVACNVPTRFWLGDVVHQFEKRCKDQGYNFNLVLPEK